MKIFTGEQIAEIDRFTIENEPITPLNLMERASQRVADWIMYHYSIENPIVVFAGIGNNGGDGLAIARILSCADYRVVVYFCKTGSNVSLLTSANFERLKALKQVEIIELSATDEMPTISSDSIVIDALFGNGLNRPLEGFVLKLVNVINSSKATVLAIDVPSGLFAEDNSANNSDGIIKATSTLTFEMPKLSFMFPENEPFLGNVYVIAIKLHPEALHLFQTPYSLLKTDSIKRTIKHRTKFSHKGVFGHALLIAGSYSKMGAAILASKSCLRAGVGLLTTHIPARGVVPFQSSIAEAMCSIDESELMFTGIAAIEQYDAIGIGPGIGTDVKTQKAFFDLLKINKKRMVIDADAINILGLNREWLSLLPKDSIITPHLKEFERIVGATSNSFERLKKMNELASHFGIIVVLKGAHTAIATPDGFIFFNSTGNPGMATAGSGDVLTGLVLGLLAQGYSSVDAACVAVFIHGLAGDIACRGEGENSLTASDIIKNIGKAFLSIAESS